jgi:DNA polymerase/3'-5' exonuclease PolX
MTVLNAEIAAVLGEIADTLETKGANPFCVRAYRNAAQMVGAGHGGFRDARYLTDLRSI